MPENAGGALGGIRVLDLGLLVQAPQAAQLLGDLGADVIKIELPGVGDQSRWIPISLEDLRAPYFVGCNRGKRSLTLDLRRTEGRDVLLRLVAKADVLVSNFVPGTLEGWGLDYETLAQHNPRLIAGYGSAFGPVGSDATRRGADLAGQAEGGLISTTGSSPDDGTPVGVTIADHIASQNLCNGILAALFARERTGHGQKVEVSLVGGQLFAQCSELTASFLSGTQPDRARGGHALIPMIYGIFATADGHIALVGVVVPERKAFFDCIGREDLAADERFAAPLFTDEVKRELFDELARTFATHSSSHWAGRFDEGGFRYARVRGYAEIKEDPSLYENGYLQRFDHPHWGPISLVGCPIRLSRTPATPGTLAPELGQHSEEILLESGYSWEEIAGLREAEVI